MRQGIPLLFRRRSAALSPSLLLRKAAACSPTPVAGLQSLSEMLLSERRKAAERGAASSTFSSFLPLEGLLRDRLEAALFTRQAAAAANRAALWDAASTLYYRQVPAGSRPRREGAKDAPISQAVAIVPFDWHTTVCATAAALPYEGVTETIFVNRLTEHCKGLSVASGAELASLLGYSGVPSFAGWVHAHFSDAVLLTRSAATAEPLFHNRLNNNLTLRVTAASAAQVSHGKPRELEGQRQQKEVAALQHALHLLGRGSQLPVWTDFANLAPLLPTDVCPAAGEWSVFLSQPHVKCLFDVDADISVRYVGKPTDTFVVIDRTSVSGAEAEAWLSKLRRSSSAEKEAALDIKVLVRAGEGGAAVQGAEVVVVERLLDPEHVIGALVNTILPSATKSAGSSSDVLVAAAAGGVGGRSCGEGEEGDNAGEAAEPMLTVHVLCGDDSVDAIMRALRDVRLPQQQDGSLAVLVHTPQAEGCAVGAA